MVREPHHERFYFILNSIAYPFALRLSKGSERIGTQSLTTGKFRMIIELSYGIQDLPADLDWLGVDKDESHHTRLGAAVDPIVDRSALHEHVARLNHVR